MPELPEVETTLRGISPHVEGREGRKGREGREGRRITGIVVRQSQLRWPVSNRIVQAIGHRINTVRRRAKYLLLDTNRGIIVLHLGMSGSLTVQPADRPERKHDHVDIVLDSGHCLRLNDPKRFGSCLWQGVDELPVRLFQNLGPEPFSNVFSGERLYTLSRERSIAVKNFIMNNAIVVGVGNIYANESLFRSGIDPRHFAGKISLKRYRVLSKQIKDVLSEAIEQGGTTLRDFYGADGKPGYFRIRLKVYGRAGEPCLLCGSVIHSVRIGQRNSFYCPQCQR